MSKRKTLLAILTPLLILVGVMAFKLWAGYEVVPVPEDPVAKATATPATVTVGKAVKFDGSGSKDMDTKITWQETKEGYKYNFLRFPVAGKVKKWEWDFDDGGSGSGKKVTHKYQKAGKYTVKLTITADHNEKASTSVKVKVGAGIRLTANPKSITSGKQTTLTATVVGNDGNTDANFNGSIDFSCDPADRLELSATSAQASGGVAKIKGTGQAVGEATVTASGEGLISGTANVKVKAMLKIIKPTNDEKITLPKIAVEGKSAPTTAGGIDWKTTVEGTDYTTSTSSEVEGIINISPFPKRNYSFGPNTVEAKITINSDKISKSVNVEYFFPKEGTQNPDSDPNWYYYWGQLKPAPCPRFYQESSGQGDYGRWFAPWQFGGERIIIYDESKESINKCTQKMRHENRHAYDWRRVWPGGRYNPSEDVDGDHVRDEWERTHPGYSDDPETDDWNGTYRVWTEYNAGLEETREPSHDHEDWSTGGANW